MIYSFIFQFQDKELWWSDAKESIFQEAFIETNVCLKLIHLKYYLNDDFTLPTLSKSFC